MKTNEKEKTRAPALSGVVSLFVFFGLMFISSLHLAKKWDAIACAAVCVIGLAGLVISLRRHPAERRAKLTLFITAAVLGGVAATAIWLFHRHWQ
jgi:hypothetical protein